MPIDPNLLTKAAKVYEAAEAVDGMKPKEVFESHKKCAPGEFGMNKEGEETVPGMAERSYLAMAQHDVNQATAPTGWQTQENRQRQALFPLLGASVGKLVGGDAGRFLGHTVGTGLSAYGAYENALYNAQQLRAGQGHDTAIADYGFAKQRGLNYKPAEEPPQLPQAQPRPPIKMPPRGVGPRPAGMNKEGEDLQSMLQNIMPQGDRPNQYALPAALGAGLGGVAGGLMSPKGKLLRGMLRGAVVGGGAGLGLGAGQTLIDNNDRTNMEFTPLGRVAVPGAGALAGLTGGLFANRLVDEAAPESDQKDNKKDKKEKAMKKESAYSFGGRVKQALDPAVGYGAAGGGLLGAGLGGLAGLVNPGEEEDEDGNVRRRSRLGAALRGALGGGAAGALGGGALGYFSPGSTTALKEMLFGLSAKKRDELAEQVRRTQPVTMGSGLEQSPDGLGLRSAFKSPGVTTSKSLPANVSTDLSNPTPVFTTATGNDTRLNREEAAAATRSLPALDPVTMGADIRRSLPPLPTNATAGDYDVGPFLSPLDYRYHPSTYQSPTYTPTPVNWYDAMRQEQGTTPFDYNNQGWRASATGGQNR